ncbi:MAG: capsule assembly Wzi family protein [Terracidiphilus sp.]
MSRTSSKAPAICGVISCSALSATLLLSAASLTAEEPPSPPGTQPAAQTLHSPAIPEPVCEPSHLDSPYVPVDSWIYPAILRLYSLGYVDNVFLGIRPWTRSSIERMVEAAGARIEDADAGPATDEAQGIYEALLHELRNDMQGPCLAHEGNSRFESVYSVMRGISGTPLRDSYHLGSTIVNDYGRPYTNGFNNYSGASGYASAGHFLIYARGEFQGAPSAAGYSASLTQSLAALDSTTDYFSNACWLSGTGCTAMPLNLQSTIPNGPIATATQGRVMEAYVSANYLNHEISFGKQDDWLGPGQGGAFAYSNNAENIYSFRINRIEPLNIPLLSKVTGPFRYEFMIGPLKGHTFPFDPWMHTEKLSFRPTENIEFGFQRTVIWGGKNHEPVNLHTFLRSFFSLSAPNAPVKGSSADPGARFGAFDFSYRLPFVRKWLTLYCDSEVHDDVSPIDAPRRASWRPGLYLSHVPGIAKLDLRAEGISTDPPVSRSVNGQFMYFEAIQRQGYTNNGQIFGDWIGREDKGGQGWITYHLSGNEWIQASARHQKAAKDFAEIPPIAATLTTPAVPAVEYGTTLNDINFQVVKRIHKEFEIDGSFAYEHWKAPIYLPGQQTVTTTNIQLTWFPNRKISF